MKKILVSGVKPSGKIHIGNYFGALKQFVDLQDEYESNIFIADYHSLTTISNKEELENNIEELAVDFLSIGIDPQKVNLFIQSDVPQVTEAAWIFDCITSIPYLMRAHAFKDAEAKNKEINVGVFNYPILMAADILLQKADVVPVGKDQKQHIEIARDIALKMNRTYGTKIKLPDPIIIENTETVIGTDGQKMSKSYKNTIPMFSSKEEIEKIVMTIPTDSKGEKEPKDIDSIIFKINSLFLDESSMQNLKDKYISGISYKDAKKDLINDINNFMGPFRENKIKWLKKKEYVKEIMVIGAQKANKNATETLMEIKNAVGLGL